MVSKLVRVCVLCAKKFALLGLIVGVSAKKFAQRAQKGQKLAFYGVPGEFFRANDARGVALGEFFRGNAAGGAVLGERCRATGVAGMPCDYR